MEGPSLSKSRSQWQSALSSATETLSCLISSSNDKNWKAVSLNPNANSQTNATQSSSTLTPAGSLSDPKGKGKSRPSLPQSSLLQDHASSTTSTTSNQFHNISDSDKTFRLSTIDPQKVVVHRRSFKGKEVIRATVDLPFAGDPNLDGFNSVLATPQTRQNWDRMVEDAEVIEVLDSQTRISKTNFRLGWPASPRDSITISRTISDGSSTLIDISTSLPRSPDAPAYLRPAPPYVRSHLHLFAWCIQFPRDNDSSHNHNSTTTTASSTTLTPFPSKEATSTSSRQKTLKITAFWSWDLKGSWLGMPSLPQQLPIIIKSLVDYVFSSSDSVATLSSYGNGIEIISRNFDITRDTLSIEYSVVSEDLNEKSIENEDEETSNKQKEKRRLENTIECSLSKKHGWDVKVSVKPSLGTTSSTDWKASAERPGSKSGSEDPNSNLNLRVKHSKIEKADESVLVKVIIQRVEASTGLRLNDSLLAIEEVEPRPPAVSSKRLLQEVANATSINVSHSSSSNSSTGSTPSQIGGGRDSASSSTAPSPNPSISNKSSAIASLIRRNYIYFTSLLQEPEAKWKHISDSRGVTVTQLDSIDPTLVVYRAEATFVGVNVWDLFSTITSGGARSFWDKSQEESILLNDLNDLSSLWQLKTKANWPVAARDSIVVSTSYKSPNSVHIFSFSTNDSNLFDGKIPKVENGVIRTQIDLRGWSVEALSPTTAHITLLEQSDPKGWTSKTATPNILVNNVAGVGDYAIKFGGPPVATRLLGAHATVSKYDHEKSTYRLEYSKTEDTNHFNSSSHSNSAMESGFSSSNSSSHSGEEVSHIECELRCDLETWSSNLDLVVDPPPINVSCLRRHKLSSGGGGLWLTIEHVAASLEDDNARITIRKGFMPKEKGLVLVNGARINVDFNEMNEEERKELLKKKRNKPMRVPLDLTNPGRIKPKAVRAFGDGESLSTDPQTPTNNNSSNDTTSNPNLLSSSASAYGSFSRAEMGHGISRPGSTAPSLGGSDRAASPAPSRNEVFSDSERPRKPMTCALDVLFLLRRIYSERNLDPSLSPAGWSLVSERNGLFIRRKLMSSISNTVSIQRSDKVVEGLNSEDFLSLISNSGCRKIWDDKVENEKILESFGNGSKIETFTSKGSFPFRGRIFFTSSLTAKSTGRDTASSSVSSPINGTPSSATSSSLNHSTVFFHASSSFDEKHLNFPSSRINPQNLPVGKVLIDGWILETLDPYSSTTFQIPSTRCTHVIAIDYAGSLPSGVNSMWNSNLPRAIQLVEEFIKIKGALPMIKNPKSLMKVLGDGRDEDNGFVWNLKENRKQKTCLLMNNFQSNEKILNLLVRIQPKKVDGEDGDDDEDDDEEERKETENKTPILTSRTLALSNASTTKGAAIQASKSSRQFNDHLKNELNVFDSKIPNRLNSSSSSNSVSARRSTSISSFSSDNGKSSSPLITPTPSTIRTRPIPNQSQPKKETINVVLEAEVELKHYSNGYEIVVASEISSSNFGRGPVKKSSNEVDSHSITGGDDGQKSMVDVSDTVSIRSVDTTTSSRTSTSTSTRGNVRGRLLPLEGAAEGRNDLPIKVSVHDLPPSAVLAATLAPASRPRKHLIRLSLPQDAFDGLVKARENSEDENLIEIDGSKEEVDQQKSKDKEAEDDWRSRLVERGALLRLIVRPISGPMDITPTGKKDEDDDDDDENGLQIAVRYEGERLNVMHVNKTSAMLQRESGGLEKYATLKRDIPTSLDEALPPSLQQPIAAALQLKADLTRKPAAASTTAASALAAVTASATSVGDGTPNRPGTPAMPDSSSSTPASPANAAHDKKPNSKDVNEKVSNMSTPTTTSVSTPIMSILGSYPLSRLSGASTAVSNALANATVTSSSTSSTANLKDSKATIEVDKTSKDASDVSKEAESSNGNATTTTQGLGEIRFSLTTLILTAIISFLIGSLVRALLSPNDFVIMPSAKAISKLNLDLKSASTSSVAGSLNPTSYLDAAAQEVEKYLNGGGSAGSGPPVSGSGASQVRELLSNARDMKRLIEIRRFFGWDLVVAVIRR